jgi:hypothetical protein
VIDGYNAECEVREGEELTDYEEIPVAFLNQSELQKLHVNQTEYYIEYYCMRDTASELAAMQLYLAKNELMDDFIEFWNSLGSMTDSARERDKMGEDQNEK